MAKKYKLFQQKNSQCHYEATLHHLWKALEIRMDGSQGLEKGKNYIHFQKSPEKALELSAAP